MGGDRFPAGPPKSIYFLCNLFSLRFSEKGSKQTMYRTAIMFFIISFYAIMHRTIVQNKIISIICSCLSFTPANIYRPHLGKVQLGRPNPNLSQSLNIYLRRKKKTFYSELYAQQWIAVQFSIFNFFKLFLKMYHKTWQNV